MSIVSILNRWRTEPNIYENITDWRSFPPHPARNVSLPDDLHPILKYALQQKGFKYLYTHQLATWQHVKSGNNPIIVSGTGSGKTLAYNLPVLDRLIQAPDARALYIFPTKALGQDQLQNLRQFLEITDHQLNSSSTYFPVPLAIYDGDTPQHTRPTIRSAARLIISNADMLHAGILPHHTAWAEFFRNLEYIVIDEIHAYRGIFGSHVGNVLRRLKRIAKFYGANPQWVFTSATIANPVELAEKLSEEPVTLIEEDGAPRGSRNFLLYNPPILDKDLGIRRSALLEVIQIVEDLLLYNVQTIIFGRARRTIELILTYLRETTELNKSNQFTSLNGDRVEEIRGYRSGYLPKQRREIEAGLKTGKVRAVVATNALELGVDIGGVDAIIMVGYPGTIASTWQQAGRAGRSDKPSLAVLVATPNPIDQFLANHPDYFHGKTPEQALVNPDNLLILLSHLRCAAFELPFVKDEAFGHISGDQVREFLEYLAQCGVIHYSGGKYFWMSDSYPAEKITLRSASADRVLLQIQQNHAWSTIGEVDLDSATQLVHPGAIYIHEAQTFHVDELDFDQHIARMRSVEVDFYTQPQSDSTVSLIEMFDQADIKGYPSPPAKIAHGEIKVVSQVVGFKRIKWFTHEVLSKEELALPPSDLITTGFWISLNEDTINKLRNENLWTNDPNYYGPNWAKQKELARVRDGFRCQMCNGVEQERAHDVHHKKPFRTFSSYLEANHINNLITLCSTCHRKVESSLRIQSGLSGIAYSLGNLAPFFLMCDTRDLGINSDPKSPLSEGAPTVVLYDRVPAGIGFSMRLFEIHAELFRSAYDLVRDCECTDGCPSCVGPGGENGSGGKKEALAIFQAINASVNSKFLGNS
jgi:DEAD/DEAH box helicase domain-containing protein